MKTTIAIRDIFIDSGLTANGEPYKLTKLYSTTRDYYTTFMEDMEFLNEVKQGSEVDLEYSNGDKPKYFKLIRIYAVRNRISIVEQERIKAEKQKAQEEAEKAQKSVLIGGFTMEELGLTKSKTGGMLTNRLIAVKRIVAKEYGIKVEDVDQKDGLVVELLAQMRSIEWQNKS